MMNYINKWIGWRVGGLQGFEILLDTWSNTVSFIGIVLNLFISTFVAVAIYKVGNNRTKQYDIHYIETMFYEAGEQYKNMISLSNALRRVLEVLEPYGYIVSEKNKLDFLIELWNLREIANSKWIELPLHKLELHEDVFDKYRSKKIRIGQGKIKSDNLENILNELNEKLKICDGVQKKAKKHVKHLQYFLIIDDCNREELKNAMRELYSKQEFVNTLSYKQIEVDWKKVEQSYLNLCEPIKSFIEVSKNIQKLIEKSKDLYSTNLIRFFC